MKLSSVIVNLKSVNRSLEIEKWGLTPYQTAWEYQKKQVQARLDTPNLADKLILIEHPSVYTLGTGATLDNIKFDIQKFSGELYRIERGGEITYHCPGQLVIYPILNLKYYQKDLHWYLRQLEEVVIEVLAGYNLKGVRIPSLTGVWINDEKVAAIGIKVKRWITMHGFAINVNCDLSGFGEIIPCGITDKSVTSIIRHYPNITMKQVQKDVIDRFIMVFSQH